MLTRFFFLWHDMPIFLRNTTHLIEPVFSSDVTELNCSSNNKASWQGCIQTTASSLKLCAFDLFGELMQNIQAFQMSLIHLHWSYLDIMGLSL